MHEEAILEEQRRALLALRSAAESGFYLAGGTGLCLRLAHRRSHDLDLFREEEFDPELLLERLEAEGVRASNIRTKPNTLWVDVHGVATSFMRFPYPNIGETDEAAAMPVASLLDIAAMKIEAIASRGAKKDFFDLYFICRTGPGLRGALEAFEKRFAGARPDVMHRLKALAYFEDAEHEPDPELLKSAHWSDVRTYFEDELRSIWSKE